MCTIPKPAGTATIPGKKRQSANNLRKVFLPHVAARLPDCGQNVIRAHEALVKFHVEKPGLLVELYPGDPRDFFDLVAHGVGTTRSQKAALFLHPGNFKGKFG